MKTALTATGGRTSRQISELARNEGRAAGKSPHLFERPFDFTETVFIFLVLIGLASIYRNPVVAGIHAGRSYLATARPGFSRDHFCRNIRDCNTLGSCG
jgi:hypothetical protein